MEKILNSLRQQKDWKQFIKKSCRKNKLNIKIASFFTPSKFQALFQRLLKNNVTTSDSDVSSWADKELKAFHWLLVVISGLQESLIQNFKEDDWEIVRSIFLDKNQIFLKYESLLLVDQEATKNKFWPQKQTQLLTEIIIKNQYSNKWTDIARELFQRSQNQFFRTGKQCRQRWLNHLDPKIKKGKWNQDEDKIIIKHILNHGKQWSHISKVLGTHRTEHMVKNRFNTLLNGQIKLTPQKYIEKNLLKQIGIRLYGDKVLILQRDNSLKENEQDIKQISMTDKMTSRFQQKIQEKQIQIHDLEKKNSPQDSKNEECMRDSLFPNKIQDYSKGFEIISLQIINFLMKQIYLPYYFDNRRENPQFSQNLSSSYFFSHSFTNFESSFNQKKFICSTFSSNQNFDGNFNR